MCSSSKSFPDTWTLSVAGPTNSLVDWAQRTFAGITGTISDWMIKYALDPLRYLLTQLPWWMLAGGTALLAWSVSHRRRLPVTCFLCLFAIGALGIWDIAMDTLSQVIVAVVLAVVIAVPVGIWSARSDHVRSALSRCSTRCRPCRPSCISFRSSRCSTSAGCPASSPR